MRLTLKISAATVLWTAAVASAIAFTMHRDDAVLVWGILTSAAAAVTSAMVAGDYIAGSATKHIVREIQAERDSTVDRATKAVQADARAREDRVVSRVQAANEALARRVATQVAEAVMADSPTQLHPR